MWLAFYDGIWYDSLVQVTRCRSNWVLMTVPLYGGIGLVDFSVLAQHHDVYATHYAVGK